MQMISLYCQAHGNHKNINFKMVQNFKINSAKRKVIIPNNKTNQPIKNTDHKEIETVNT